MLTSARLLYTGLIASGFALVCPAVAAAVDPATVCTLSKRKAATKKVSSKLTCAAKAATSGVSVDPACLAKAETKFAAAYANAELKGGCLTVGNAAAVEALVDTCVGLVRGSLGTGGSLLPRSGCASAKLKASAKKLVAKSGCQAKALAKHLPVDPLCLGTAESKFSKEFAKAEARTDCLELGDVTAAEAQLDLCLAVLLGAEPGPTTTTTTTSTTTTTTTTTTTLTPPPCILAAYPACGGICAPGLVCAPQYYSHPIFAIPGCGCVAPDAPCSGSQPVCADGACPPGMACLQSTERFQLCNHSCFTP